MEIVDPRVHPNLLPDGSKALIVNGPDKEWNDLPAIKTSTGYIITRWSPNQEERMAILRGEDIYLTLIAFDKINPMFMSIGQVDWTVPYWKVKEQL